MDRTTVMALRLPSPALAALSAAGVLWVAGSGLAGQPMLAGLASEWAAVVHLALILVPLLFLFGAARLWRWTQGHGLDCPVCGHLLGREREGRFGTYRKCLGCGKNISRINYA